MKKYFFFLLTLFFFCPTSVFASESNHFVTVVNPVRGKNLWQSSEAVEKQIQLIKSYKIPATWLLQYDALTDDSSIKLFKNLSDNQEIGIFLEISDRLASDSFVGYILGKGDWAQANKVLLSGYLPSERKRMIDKVFNEFYKIFGFYPSSVGAWYIDALSLNYLVAKYNIKSVLYVADQYQTDSYGVWGQPWGTPYYPSRFNTLIPGYKDRLDVVKIQWAQRDPVRGYGLNVSDSIYSLQANDYINNNLDFGYFKKLAQVYLNSDNPLSQLTVGLETGQEAAVFFDEFKNQLEFLLQQEKSGLISFQTMSSFAGKFNSTIDSSNAGFLIYGSDYFDPDTISYWFSNDYYRVGLIMKGGNLYIRDLREYKSVIFEGEIVGRDENKILKRIIPADIDDAVWHNGRLIAKDISNVKVNRSGENIIFSIVDNANNLHELKLGKREIYFDQKNVFTYQEQNNFKYHLRNFALSMLTNLQLLFPSDWFGSWRCSVIDGQVYLGFMNKPNQLIGIRSKFPFLGSFTFPFQTLVRFKTLPNFDAENFFSSYLVNWLNHSTIK